ncbi:caspase family protein [Streptomyces sp. NPDC057287]|uniref:caspase family protein n=1 Tax=Streptomyces sp. NPDC057287 TaxID=3346086 RepID=UPI003629A0CF
MTSIRALLVGINEYSPGTAPRLSGCVNDISDVRALLAGRTARGHAPDVHVLLDREATVAAVEDGIRHRLGAAGPGDTALLWFSGHGTETPAHGADLLIEATGRNQALLCTDGPLPDKRLRVLLDEVAARGARVVAVLDCCFSGGATRDPAFTARFAPAPGHRVPAPASSRDAAPTERAAGSPANRDVLLLAACRLDQRAYETYFGGRRQGVFTRAVLDAVREAGPDITYREVLAAADARVRCSGGHQQPVLLPAGPGGTADAPFLADGARRLPAGEHLLRHGPEGWEVDCGAGHGLPEGDTAAGSAATEFTVVDAEQTGRSVAVRTVLPDRSLVEPLGWAPAPGRVHPVALGALSLPAATFALLPDADAGACPVEDLALALATAGPLGGPSPLLRQVTDPRQAGDLHFRVEVRGSAAHILRRDGSPFVGPQRLGVPGDARRIADCLIHLTRWHRLRDLPPRPSPLDGLVRVEIVPWGAEDGQPLSPDGSGEIVCAYGPGASAPLLSVRLHNRSADRPLWCLLLDLTDGYASHSALYPGHFIAPGHTGHALDGQPVQFSLPRDRPPVPGAQARDWLKLVVAEHEIGTVPFHLPAWSADPSGAREDPPPRDDGVLRFGPPRRGAYARDLGMPAGGSYGRWTTRTVPLRIVVPTA